jgi:hypothetical protein
MFLQAEFEHHQPDKESRSVKHHQSMEMRHSLKAYPRNSMLT